jgi:hypothetical protein
MRINDRGTEQLQLKAFIVFNRLKALNNPILELFKAQSVKHKLHNLTVFINGLNFTFVHLINNRSFDFERWGQLTRFN